MKRKIVLLLALLPALLIGCGEAERRQVAGTVTLDGQPLEEGIIRFEAVQGQRPSAAAIIEQGRYTVAVAPGRVRVVIEGYEKIGEHRLEGEPNAPPVEIKRQIVPARYNRQSELTALIDADRDDLDFVLRSP